VARQNSDLLLNHGNEPAFGQGCIRAILLIFGITRGKNRIAQVGRRLAEKLLKSLPQITGDIELEGLDPDVVEAACLAHDLAHPRLDTLRKKRWIN
jgi:hypothetical protein